MPPNSKDRELYMEVEYRLTSSQYPQSNKRRWWQRKKSELDFTTKESKSRKYRAKLGSAVQIPGIIPRQTGNPRFRFAFSCPLRSETFNHRIIRLVGTHEGLWSEPLSS